MTEIRNPVIWKKQVVLVVGAASSREYSSRTVLPSLSRLEAAPTKVDNPVNQSVVLVIIFHITLSVCLLPRRGHFLRA